jgi:hypothetical protein
VSGAVAKAERRRMRRVLGDTLSRLGALEARVAGVKAREAELAHACEARWKQVADRSIAVSHATANVTEPLRRPLLGRLRWLFRGR